MKKNPNFKGQKCAFVFFSTVYGSLVLTMIMTVYFQVF